MKIAGCVFAAVLLIFCGPNLAQSQERSGVLEALVLSGSQNLRSYALSHPELPHALHATRARMLERDGFRGTPGQLMYRHIALSPVVTYDGNINGGAVGDSLVLAGLRFQIRDDLVSKNGALIGGNVEGAANFNIASATALQLGFGAWTAWSPEHEISKGGTNLSACVAHQATAATRLRGCSRASHLEYDLGKTQRVSFEVGASRAYAAQRSFNEVDLSLRIDRIFGVIIEDQNILSFRHTSAHQNGLAFTIGGSVGDDTIGISMRERIYVSTSAWIAGQPTSFQLSAQNNRGGLFLGESRTENIYTFGLSRRVRQNLTVRLTGSKVEAKHEFFNNKSFGLDLDFQF